METYRIKIKDQSTPVLLMEDGTEIYFKDEGEILRIISERPTGHNVSSWVNLNKGQTFDLPENIGVSFEDEQYMGSETENSFTIGYRKLAILTPITEATEPEDITIKPIYTSEMKVRVAPVKSEGEESFNAESMPPINTVEEQGYKETTSIISGLQIKIDELKDRKSDYWRGVRDGYQSALDFIVKQEEEELPFGK